jgi:tRNA pseudouridine55 synthase
VSAIKVDGERAYALARKGEAPELASRAVRVLELSLLSLTPPTLRVELHVSKGYYVRSLARDLGRTLGAPAHLSALRRLASGPFGLDQACPWPAQSPPGLLGLAEAAASVLPPCRIATVEAVARARQGKLLAAEDFTALPSVEGPGAWLSPEGELVAIGATHGELRVVRGFSSEA